MDEKTFVWNGINAETGDYLLRPKTWDELVDCILGGIDCARARAGRLEKEVRALESEELPQRRGEPPPDVDVADLASTGWGVIFAQTDDGTAREGLAELLDHRRFQAGNRYQEFLGEGGYRQGDDRNRWLSRHGLGPGIGDPDRVPYYLLIAGEPSDVPFDFQFDLGARYAVGRIAFETREEYERYARNVLEAESAPSRPREVTFFGVQNPDDPATAGKLRHMILPLLKQVDGAVPNWEVKEVLREAAAKARLGELLGGAETPAVLFTTSHGMAPGQEGRLLDRVGALLCDEYPGPETWRGRGPIPPEFYFAARDVSEEADLRGLVAVLIGCYTVGMPEHDSFCVVPPRRLGPRPMISPLPRRLLGKERGVVAVIGHVDRLWDFSYVWEKAGSQPQTFKAVLNCLLAGQPVGAAARFLGDRYADLGLDLKRILLDFVLGREVDRKRLAELWVAEADARSYMLLGDPAARIGAMR